MHYTKRSLEPRSVRGPILCKPPAHYPQHGNLLRHDVKDIKYVKALNHCRRNPSYKWQIASKKMKHMTSFHSVDASTYDYIH